MSLPVVDRGAVSGGVDGTFVLGGPAVAAGGVPVGDCGARAAGDGAAGVLAAGVVGVAGAVGVAGGRAAGVPVSGSSRRGGRGGCSLPDEVTTRFADAGFAGDAAGAAPEPASVDASGARSASPAGLVEVSGAFGASAADASARSGSDFLAFLAFALAGLGCSGCASRIRPSRSAFRRTRSACASSMLEEWLFAPMPSASQRSSVSLLVSPSSFASSWMRILEAKWFYSPSYRCRWFGGSVVRNVRSPSWANQSRTKRGSKTNVTGSRRRVDRPVLRSDAAGPAR